MKTKLTSLLLAACFAGVTAFGQPGMSGPPVDATMAKLFGKNTSFSAKADFTIQRDGGKQPVTMAVDFNMLDGKTRTEMDMTKSSLIPPAAIEQMKKMGMDRMITISDMRQGINWVIYPTLQAYAQVNMGTPPVPGTDKDPQIQKTSLGKESLDGHACEKNNVTITDDKGTPHTFVVWNATDLQDFPVQMQMSEGGNNVTIKYHDIKLEKPDAKLFDSPDGYKKYDSVPGLMQGEMMKRMSGGAPK